MFKSRGVKGKEIILGSMFCLESFPMKADGVSKFLSSSVDCRRVYFAHLKESRFVEDVLFYPNHEVGAFPKIEVKWDWVSDIHVNSKFEAVIWS